MTINNEHPQCRHSRIEYFLDPDKEKYYGECEVCGSVGPCRNTKSLARDALKSIIAYRDHGQGGFRENAGRPKSVDASTKTRGFEVDDERFAVFLKWKVENGFGKNSQAVRWLFDNLHKLKVPKRERVSA